MSSAIQSFKLFSTWIIFLVLISNSQCKTSRRTLKKATYGSPCNSTTKCDIHSLLSCEENVCQCIYQDAMVYNPELGTCVSFTNELCGYLETKQVFIHCVPNAFCDQQQGICKCNRDFVESVSERRCVMQKGYGETCHSDSECLGDLSLVCFEETCQCDPENFAAHSDSTFSAKKCISLAGKPCTLKAACVPNASCVGENGLPISNVGYGWMQPGVCKCESGYEIDENGYCRGKHRSRCDVLGNILCSPNFRCFDGICDCKYPDDQIYLEETGKCHSVVGGPCSVENEFQKNETTLSDEILCLGYLECKNVSDKAISTCGCKEGFVENRNRECSLPFGSLCTGSSLNSCDEAADLHCVDGRCACKDDLKEYDTVLGKCVGKVGASCDVPATSNMFPNPTRNSCWSKSNIHGTDDEQIFKQSNNSHKSITCSKNATCQLLRSQLTGLTRRGVCTSTLQVNSDKQGGEDPIDADNDDNGGNSYY